MVRAKGGGSRAPCMVRPNTSWVMVTWDPISLWTDRQTNRTKNITFSQLRWQGVKYLHRTENPMSAPDCGPLKSALWNFYCTYIHVLCISRYGRPLQWWIQNFTEEGRQPFKWVGGVGANIRLCQFFPKTAWNWKNLDPWGASKILLCRSVTALLIERSCEISCPLRLVMLWNVKR